MWCSRYKNAFLGIGNLQMITTTFWYEYLWVAYILFLDPVLYIVLSSPEIKAYNLRSWSHENAPGEKLSIILRVFSQNLQFEPPFNWAQKSKCDHSVHPECAHPLLLLGGLNLPRNFQKGGGGAWEDFNFERGIAGKTGSNIFQGGLQFYKKIR